MTVKVSKAQRALFDNLARNYISHALLPLLQAQGMDVDEGFGEFLLQDVDVSELSDTLAQHFLAGASYKEIKGAFDVVQSPNFQKVMALSAQVSEVIHEQVIEIIRPMIPGTVQL